MLLSCVCCGLLTMPFSIVDACNNSITLMYCGKKLYGIMSLYLHQQTHIKCHTVILAAPKLIVRLK
jgi:hypothetical protein